MNWGQLKDPVSHMCLAVAGSNNPFSHKYFVTEFSENIFGENSIDLSAFGC